MPKRRSTNRINYGNAQEFQIWEVARAATAAPFYFEPLEIETPGNAAPLLFTDGGFSSTNNPTAEGTREIEDLYGSNSVGVVVSVGTAKRNSPSHRRGLRAKVKDMGDKATDPENIHHDWIAKSSEQKFRYYRLNEPGGLHVELDEWKPKQNLYTKNSGQATLKTIQDVFARWAAKIETTQLLPLS